MRLESLPTALFTHRALAVLTDQQPGLEAAYAALKTAAPQVGHAGPIHELLERVASSLEIPLALGAVSEVLVWLGPRDAAELRAAADRWQRLATDLAGFDPVPRLVHRLSELGEILDRDPALTGMAVETARSLLPELARFAAGKVASTPVDALVQVGAAVGAEELAHRCRRAADRLASFVARNAPDADARLHLAGRAYAEGRLSAEEVAGLLSRSVPDVVADLERLGFARSIESIRLGPEARARALDAIQQRRRATGSQLVVDPRAVTRDVLATQRIEDVDARPWAPVPRG